MDIARTARDYYEGRFEAYVVADYGRILAIRDNAPNRRSIPYVRAIIDAKIRRMYMSDPKRTITDNPQATEYLNSLYSKGPGDAKDQGFARLCRPWRCLRDSGGDQPAEERW